MRLLNTIKDIIWLERWRRNNRKYFGGPHFVGRIRSERSRDEGVTMR